MTNLKRSICAVAGDESGVTALEYALIAAIIAVVIIGAVMGVGDKARENFEILEVAVAGPEVPGDTALGPDGVLGSGGGDGAGQDEDSPGSGGGGDGELAGGGAPGPAVAGDTPEDSVGAGGGGGEQLALGTGGGTSGASGGTSAFSIPSADPVSGGGEAGAGGSGGPLDGGDGLAGDGNGSGGDAVAATSRASPAEVPGAAGPPGPEAGLGSAWGARETSPADEESDHTEDGAGDGASAVGFVILTLWLLTGLALIFLGWMVVRRIASEKRAREEEERSERAVLRYQATPETGAPG